MSPVGHSRRFGRGHVSSHVRSSPGSGLKFSGPATVAMCHLLT